MWKTLLVIAFLAAAGNAKDCVPRSFGTNKIVCVCNATYCDDMPQNHPEVLEEGKFYWYVSTEDGQRFNLSESTFDTQEQSAEEILTLNSTEKYQKIIGFGTAFTDSAGINIAKLSQATQEQLIRTYFDPETGSGYTLGRVPIGGTDFSTRPYTYDDVENDNSLKHFSLAMEDYSYKIPYMKLARKWNPKLKFFSAAWSPPTWMKTNDEITGFGFLKRQYYQIYAKYIVKFLDAYKDQGLDIWAVSTGNEPINAVIPFNKINTMGWTPQTVADWVANHLGPTLVSSGNNNTLILVHEDQRVLLPWLVDLIYQNEKARNFSTGITLHWYADNLSSPNVLDLTHDHYPEKFILMSEACSGSASTTKVDLGSWSRGQDYILSIIEYLNHWSTGWVDWNFALDETGGPNWINNTVDSPIIVNATADEFYKQSMFYALKHVSRFVDVGSDKISITETDNIKATAVLTPDNRVVVVLYNNNSTARSVTLKDVNKGSFTINVPAHSMNTIVYKQ